MTVNPLYFYAFVILYVAGVILFIIYRTDNHFRKLEREEAKRQRAEKENLNSSPSTPDKAQSTS